MNGPTEDLMSYLSAIDSKSRCGWGRASFARQKGDQSSWIGSGIGISFFLEFAGLRARSSVSRAALFQPAKECRFSAPPSFGAAAMANQSGYLRNPPSVSERPQHATPRQGAEKSFLIGGRRGGAMYCFLLADAQDLPPPPHAPRPRRSECKGDSRMSG